jgi:hypothetical protein
MVQVGITHYAVAENINFIQLTFRDVSVTEQNVIVYFVRINALHANIDVTDHLSKIMFLQTILVNKRNDTKTFLKYIIKTKTIVYDPLRQCLREAHLSSQNKQ